MKKLFQPLAKALSVCAMLLVLNFSLLAPTASAQPVGYNKGFFPYHPFYGSGFFPHSRFRRGGFFPYHRFQFMPMGFFPHHRLHGAGLPHHRLHGAGLAHHRLHGAGLPHHRLHGGGLPYQRFHGAGFFPPHHFYLAKHKAKMQRMM